MNHEIETKIEIERELNLLSITLQFVLFVLLIVGMELRNHEVDRQLHHIYLDEFEYPKCDTLHMDRATTYQPTTAQCDSNPLTTADGSLINPECYQRWVALSRDLLSRWGGEFSYGDTIEVYSKGHPNLNGYWVVHDCMNAKYKMSIDFLLEPENNYPKLGVGTDVKIIICGE